jgi:membrane fusion protein, multidrug efflux system
MILRVAASICGLTAVISPSNSVVSTGAFKLRNGQAITVDNTLTPEFLTDPTPNDR